MKCLLLGMALSILSAFSSGQPPLKLSRPKPLFPGVDAFPLLITAGTAALKVNTDLRSLNRWAREQFHACSGTSEDGDKMFFTRKISVTSQGPRFLGFRIFEESGCGGVHSYSIDYGLTYDLETGMPVHWSRYFTPGLANEARWSSTLGDPAKVTYLQSTRLESIFASASKDLDQAHSQVFTLYPAPNQHGLAVLPADLAAALQGTEQPVILGEAELVDLQLNQRPRKTLDFETPAAKLQASVASIH